MRNLFLFALLAAALLVAPASAQQAETAVSMQEAMDIAKNAGVQAVSTVTLDRGYWRVEGFDGSGNRVVLEVDAISGVVLRR